MPRGGLRLQITYHATDVDSWKASRAGMNLDVEAFIREVVRK
jgi:hypothetical protein